MSQRLALAAEAGALSTGDVVVFNPTHGLDLSAFSTQTCTIVTDMMPEAELFGRAGFDVVQETPNRRFNAAVVFLPRAKAEARHRIWQASQVADRILVDGQKTDGVDALMKEVRRKVALSGHVSKAHGKLFWFDGPLDAPDWKAKPGKIESRWRVAPGVFSADGIDPGSAALLAALPNDLAGHAADLGAGWGHLAGSLLERSAGIKTMHLVEAQHSALACAQTNVADPRAEFHWADATSWSGARNLDVVVMNPPFHTGRAADPDLGRAFIASAARLLRRGGVLWMVANRHLPYEQNLRNDFGDVDEMSGTSKFKVMRAIATGKKRG